MPPKSMPASQYQPQDACQLSYRQTQYFHSDKKILLRRIGATLSLVSGLFFQSPAKSSSPVAYLTDCVIC